MDIAEDSSQLDDDALDALADAAEDVEGEEDGDEEEDADDGNGGIMVTLMRILTTALRVQPVTMLTQTLKPINTMESEHQEVSSMQPKFR